MPWLQSYYSKGLAEHAAPCYNGNESACPEFLTPCFSRETSFCSSNGSKFVYSDRYDDPSAAWVMMCAILMFFMKAGFLFVEQAFSVREAQFRRRVVLTKYIDIFGGTLGFWLFGYALSGNTDARVLGEEQDYIFWFFRFTFATNTATILGGTLVGQSDVHMRAPAIFIYSFIMTALIHPILARIFWSAASPDLRGLINMSPYQYCNGTFVTTRQHEFNWHDNGTVNYGNLVFIDFAGSGLVHLCGGIGGFVLAVFHKIESSNFKWKWYKKSKTARNPSPRDSGRESQEKPKPVTDEGTNIVSRFFHWMYPCGGGDEFIDTAALGILILWTTWFAFNAGSTESIHGKTLHAAVGRIALTMCLACASAGTTQTCVSGLVQFVKKDETFNTNEIANAVLGGLVAVTGCCPFIQPEYAILIGVFTVLFYHIGCVIEYALGLHDGARVFPVHAMCGFWGLLCVGFFSKPCFIKELYEDLCFCVESYLPTTIDADGLRIGYQLLGGIIITGWSFAACTATFLFLWLIPVKILTFNFNRFKGSLLFTHFGEIDTAPTGRKRLTPEARNRLTTTLNQIQLPEQPQYGSTDERETLITAT